MNFEIAPKETEIQATWDEAKMYCFSLNIDGKIGWRLPTKEELYDIFDSDSRRDFAYAIHWSSTEIDTNNAWTQRFNVGFEYSRNKNNLYYVRAVRDLKAY